MRRVGPSANASGISHRKVSSRHDCTSSWVGTPPTASLPVIGLFWSLRSIEFSVELSRGCRGHGSTGARSPTSAPPRGLPAFAMGPLVGKKVAEIKRTVGYKMCGPD
jgi:hypothetical protein